jgi:hypothetical protein
MARSSMNIRRSRPAAKRSSQSLRGGPSLYGSMGGSGGSFASSPFKRKSPFMGARPRPFSAQSGLGGSGFGSHPAYAGGYSGGVSGQRRSSRPQHAYPKRRKSFMDHVKSGISTLTGGIVSV